MSEKKFSRGGKNQHLTTTEKLPCSKCGTRVDHYPDGTISKHRVHEYEIVGGVSRRTGKSSYCSQKRWYD